MDVLEKIIIVLCFLFRFAIRVVVTTIFTLISPVVIPLLYFAGRNLDKLERAYLEWIFFGEFKSK